AKSREGMKYGRFSCPARADDSCFQELSAYRLKDGTGKCHTEADPADKNRLSVRNYFIDSMHIANVRF
ncbi:MAG TPA: hypothetical protein VGH29_15310, partial [Candidatus Binataceae bacterium]